MERRCALLEINQQLKVAVKLEEQTLRKVSLKVLTGLTETHAQSVQTVNIPIISILSTTFQFFLSN